MTHDNSPQESPYEPVGDAIDADLHSLGEQLRATAAVPASSAIATGALTIRVRQLQRLLVATSFVAVVVTAALVASLFLPVASDLPINRPQTNPNETRGATELDQGDNPDALAMISALDDEPIDPTKVELVSTLSQFESCEPLLQELREVGAAHVGSYGFGSRGDVYSYRHIDALAADESSSPAASLAFSDSVGQELGVPETLGTNVIVEGIDEADYIKATGSFVLSITTNKLRITDTNGPKIVAELELSEHGPQRPIVHDNGYVEEPRIEQWYSSMVVDGDHVVVFGSERVLEDAIPGDPSATRLAHSYTTVTFVDISDPAKPEVTERARIEGAHVTVRRVGNQVRLLTRSAMADLPFVFPSGPNSVAKSLHDNRLAVANSTIDDWIPHWDRGDGTEQNRIVDCDQVALPDTFAGVQMTSMIQFPTSGPFVPQAHSILAPGSRLTATATDVVVAAQVWVDPIHQQKEFRDWKTALHRFSFTETGPVYRGSGQVSGTIRDDFSLSVLSNDTIAAVTVDLLPWEYRRDTKVMVRTLATETATQSLVEVDQFQPTDAVVGTAGVRFTGDRLLLATGGMGNVLTAVDLSDPESMVDLGVVHLPHVASYFHRVGDNQVLSIGTGYRMVNERLLSDFVAVLIDVTATPSVQDTWTIEQAGSNATFDHHSFLWWPQRAAALFGITNQQSVMQNNNSVELPHSAAFLHIADSRLQPKLMELQEADLGPKCRLNEFPRDNCDDTGRARVTRMLVIEGRLWVYTSESLEGFDPDTLRSFAMLPLRNP